MSSKVALLLLFLLAAIPIQAADEITCTGLWSADLTETALIRAFGRANVERGSVYVAEGTDEEGTILFSRDDARRVEIVWKDKRRRRRPDWIRLPGPSQWITLAGMHNGMSLAAVGKLNARAFTLYGFDWDYGGSVTDWHGGRLAKLKSPCTLQIRFGRTIPDEPAPGQQKAIDATSGDRELLSSAPELQAFPVEVSEIVIRYPK